MRVPVSFRFAASQVQEWSARRSEKVFACSFAFAQAGWNKQSMCSAFFDTIADDLDVCHPESIKKVFCSQSVVLMLKYALDPEGSHSGLLRKLRSLNSRLVSPKQVQDILREYGASEISNDELAHLSGIM